MSYAAASDVQSEFKSIDFSASGAILAAATVTTFIEQEEASLDSEVSQIYVTPITSTSGVPFMKRLSVFMVKARILDLLAVKTGNEKLDQGGSGAEAYRTLVRETLDRIKKKELTIPGATLVAGSSGVSSYSSANNVEQVFRKDKQQW